MTRSLVGIITAALAATVLVFGGCAVAQSAPPPLRPFGEIESVEHGEVVSVNDTMIDLRSGMGRAMRTSSPMVPVGPIGLRVPITVGGEKRQDVPGEEITVKLATGKMVTVTQELSSPPFAPGEKVKVLHEKRSEVTGNSRMRVERE